MTRPLRFLPEAREEYDHAVGWYEEQRESLGEDFILEVRDTLKRIFERPHMFAKVFGEARKARVRV